MKSLHDLPVYIRIQDIAEQMSVSRRTVNRWVSAGILPSITIGGVRLFKRNDLENLVLHAQLRSIHIPSPSTGQI